MVVDGVLGSHAQLDSDADFIRFVEDGYLHCLAGYTRAGEPWPSSTDGFEFRVV
jgi:hypothetical protein